MFGQLLAQQVIAHLQECVLMRNFLLAQVPTGSGSTNRQMFRNCPNLDSSPAS